MRAGELWWEGKTEALEYKLDKMAPACLIGPIKSVFSRPAVHAQGGREGGGPAVRCDCVADALDGDAKAQAGSGGHVAVDDDRVADVQREAGHDAV